MLLVDVHSHLDNEVYDSDLQEVIDRAKEAGVKAILNAGINPESNRKTLELCKRFDIIKPALGLHPGEIQNINDAEIEAELEFIRNNKDLIAIGEIGLDYHWVKEEHEREKQREIFRKQLMIAKELDKPVIVHSRKAEDDVFRILEEFKISGAVIHCYTGPKKMIGRGVKNRWLFSVPTSIVYSTQMQDLAKEVPITQLLTETDCPYFHPFKEKRNEPVFVTESIKKIAEIKGMDSEEVANNVFMNWKRLQ